MRCHRVACPERSEGTSGDELGRQPPSAVRVAGGARNAAGQTCSEVPYGLITCSRPCLLTTLRKLPLRRVE